MAEKVMVNYSEIESLAPMPKTLAYLARIHYQPDVWLGEVAKVLEVDQALTANILRMANSAWSHNLEPIFTVKEALVRIGLDNVLNLALISSLATPLSKACPGYDMAENELFRHSLLAYLAADSLNNLDNIKVPKMAGTAALLHDIGKLILERYIGRDIRNKINNQINNTHCSEIEAENEILGTNHAKIGMEIAKLWSFPKELTDAILLHHSSSEESNELLDAVKLGNLMAKFLAKSASPEKEGVEKIKQIDPVLFEKIKLDNSDLALLCVMIDSEYKKISQIVDEY